MMPSRAQRLLQVKDYLFSFIDETRALAEGVGLALVPLGVGDCDLPTPPHVVEAMRQAVRDPLSHRYPPYAGTEVMRGAAARFLARRFQIQVDPGTEAVVTLGNKEAMAYLTLAYIEPGDVVLVPDPAYPVHETWARFCGGEVYRVPLRAESGFPPDLDTIPRDIAARAKLFWICYPNNPTAALATAEFFDRLTVFALTHDIVVASDAAYVEIYYDTEPPPSFLAPPGAMDCGIEFHSLSKAYTCQAGGLGSPPVTQMWWRHCGRLKPTPIPAPSPPCSTQRWPRLTTPPATPINSATSTAPGCTRSAIGSRPRDLRHCAPEPRSPDSAVGGIETL